MDGPLSFQGEVTCRGPVVRLGANPGPGEMRLNGYRGLDDRHAVITCYEGGKIGISPVGENQVRVGPHEFTEWEDLQSIRKPVFLAEGNAIPWDPLEGARPLSSSGPSGLGSGKSVRSSRTPLRRHRS